MSIYSIINELKSTRSRNEKESILKREQGNEVLKEFFRLALNPFILFYQKKKFHIPENRENGITLADAMRDLEATISKRVMTGNAAIEVINGLLRVLEDEGDCQCIQHILKKESGCDLGGATINKIWPKLIPSWPTLLATAYEEKLALKLNWSRGVIQQLKSDGLRVNLVIDEEGSVSAFSRAGKQLDFFGTFDFLGERWRSVVIDGELLTVKPDGKFNNRQTSNGICSKAIKGTMSQAEADTLHMMVWDAISLEDFLKEASAIEYEERFDVLGRMTQDLPKNKKITLIPSEVVYSLEDAIEKNDVLIAAGEEGSMLKDKSLPWGDLRSKLQLKLKSEHPGDFVVLGYKPGVGKLTGNLGSLVIGTSCGKLEANMSGFSLKFRCEIWANLTGKDVSYTMVIDNEEKVFVAKPGDCDINIGSILECTYNGKIKARDSEFWSLFLPRFSKSRNDKTIANTLEELK